VDRARFGFVGSEDEEKVTGFRGTAPNGTDGTRNQINCLLLYSVLYQDTVWTFFFLRADTVWTCPSNLTEGPGPFFIGEIKSYSSFQRSPRFTGSLRPPRVDTLQLGGERARALGAHGRALLPRAFLHPRG
jgi:hypothetical protein